MNASNTNDERQRQIDLNRDQVWIDTIKKELKHQKLYTEYTQNPYSKVFFYTEKPNIDSEVGEIDDNLRRMIERSRLEPRQKFAEPQTENQEYGWISTPLFERSRDDRRFFFGKSERDVTKFNTINSSKKSENNSVNK